MNIKIIATSIISLFALGIVIRNRLTSLKPTKIAVEPEVASAEIDHSFNLDDLVIQEENRSFQESKKTEPKLPDKAELIISLNLVARHSQGFNGRELLEAFSKLNFILGDKKIFHKIEDHDPELLFSIAAGTDTGAFDFSAPDTLYLRSLCLFIILPGPTNPMHAFEEMLTSAQILASTLHGELHDGSFSKISSQILAHYRQQIRDYVRKMLIAATA